MKKDFLIILIIILVGIFTLKDLFKPYFYTSHDGVHQVVRLYYFDKLIKDGQIPPRYVPQLLGGNGYPLFSFSYHMPWIIAEPMHLLGLDIFQSIKATFMVGFILSGLTMYFLQKKLFGRVAAIGGAVVYLFAPNRFLHIFVRAAIGDATAFIFPPLILLSLFMLKKEKKINWVWTGLGALATGLLLLSHAMVYLFFMMAFSLYVLYSLLFLREKKSFILSVLLMFGFSVLISAYYFIPSLVERNFTIFSSVMGSAFIGNTFLTLKELLYSLWGYGMMRASEGGMSFQIGFAQWAAVLLSGLIILYQLLNKRIKVKNPGQFNEGIFFFLIFFSTIFLMLPYSYIFWVILSRIAVIDFTWRILPLTVFSASILAGFVLSRIKYRWIFLILFISLALYANRNHTRINKIQDWDVPFYLKLERSTNDADEYTPVWTHMDLVKLKKARVEFTDNNADIKILKENSKEIVFTMDVKESGKAKINTIYYPGWNVYVNGRKTEVNHVNNGYMEFELGRGMWDVRASFEETPLRLFSDILSIGSVIFLGGAILVNRKK